MRVRFNRDYIEEFASSMAIACVCFAATYIQIWIAEEEGASAWIVLKIWGIPIPLALMTGIACFLACIYALRTIFRFITIEIPSKPFRIKRGFRFSSYRYRLLKRDALRKVKRIKKSLIMAIMAARINKEDRITIIIQNESSQSINFISKNSRQRCDTIVKGDYRKKMFKFSRRWSESLFYFYAPEGYGLDFYLSDSAGTINKIREEKWAWERRAHRAVDVKSLKPGIYTLTISST